MQRRKDLTLADKVRVLEELSNKKSQTSLAAVFGVSQSQISRIGKNRELILARYMQTDNCERKRNREVKDVDIETALIRWYVQSQASSVPISGPILMEKAIEIAAKMDIKDFYPSPIWLQKWKRDNKVGLIETKSRSDSSVDCVETWVNHTLPDILKDFHPDDIYSCSEAALFYKMLPDDTPNESSPRMTVLFCCNMSGRDRMVPYVIGVRKEYEKNVMPPCIVNNDNALMTSHLFTKWLMDLDQQLEREDRAICLVMEKSPVHIIDFPLNNIRWFYTPSSDVFQLHPISLGIVRNFKCHYRRELLTVFAMLQGNAITCENFSQNFNMTAAVGLIGDAWRKVTRSTIATCFHMAMFETKGVNSPGVEYVTAPENMTEEEFSIFVDVDAQIQCSNVPDYCKNFPILSWSSFNHENSLPMSAYYLPDQEIPVKSSKHGHDIHTENPPSILRCNITNGVEKGITMHQEDIISISASSPTADQAVEACKILRQFLECNGIEDFRPFYEIDLQVRSVMASSKRLKLKHAAEVSQLKM